MKKERTSLDIANGPLLKNIFIFAVPLMFSEMLQILFNSADTIIVGKFAGDTALAAVGATGSIVFLLTSLFYGLSTGSNVLIARCIGNNNQKKISDAVHSSIVIAIAGGMLLTCVGVLFARNLLEMMELRKTSLIFRLYTCASISRESFLCYCITSALPSCVPRAIPSVRCTS